MEYFYIKLIEGKYHYYDHAFSCWVENERIATRFTLDERNVIEKFSFLTGGSFIKVRA